MSQATITPAQGTVAGRPQPQTTTQPMAGPFIRHAPDAVSYTHLTLPTICSV